MRNKMIDWLCDLVIVGFLFKLLYQPRLKRLGPPATAKELAVRQRVQEKTNWCWLAAAQMVGAYCGREESQTAICRRVMGREKNWPGYPGMIKRALQYMTGQRVSWHFRVTLETLKTSIDNGYPVVISVRRKGLLPRGHALVAAGYRDDRLLLIDPGAGCRPRYYSYRELCLGTQLESGYGKYLQTWLLR